MRAMIVWSLLASSVVSAQDLKVEGRTYNPSCPGYFSQALLDAIITYVPHEAQRDQVHKVVLHYSFREAWHHDSWQRPVAIEAFQRLDSGVWNAELKRVEVAARGSYTMSHLEFAIQMQLNDGTVVWDNGGRAPMGFYSASLPTIQCEAPVPIGLTIQAKAHEGDYSPQE